MTDGSKTDAPERAAPLGVADGSDEEKASERAFPPRRAAAPRRDRDELVSLTDATRRCLQLECALARSETECATLRSTLAARDAELRAATDEAERERDARREATDTTRRARACGNYVWRALTLQNPMCGGAADPSDDLHTRDRR